MMVPRCERYVKKETIQYRERPGAAQKMTSGTLSRVHHGPWAVQPWEGTIGNDTGKTLVLGKTEDQAHLYAESSQLVHCSREQTTSWKQRHDSQLEHLNVFAAPRQVPCVIDLPLELTCFLSAKRLMLVHLDGG